MRNGRKSDAAIPRVGLKALRVVNHCHEGIRVVTGNGYCLKVPCKEGPANYVPAAAVIRRGRALSGITGLKASVGGLSSPW